MTDIIKGEIDAKSSNIRAKIKSGEIDIAKHVSLFKTEMKDVGATQNTLFILFGNEAYQHFKKHLGSSYPNFVLSKHYSYAYATDAKIIDEIWSALEQHSQKTQEAFGTLPFSRSEAMNQSLETLSQSK